VLIQLELNLFFYQSHIIFFLIYIFLLGIFLVYIFNAIPKVPHTQPPIPYPPTPPFWPWCSPVLGHIKFASPIGLSLQWWPTRPSFDTYAAKDKSSRVLVSSYCCSTYRDAVPFSSLGNFSSSSIRGRVTHPIADCDHPLLCLLGPGIVSQERAISGSFQQNLASVCTLVLKIFLPYFLWSPSLGRNRCDINVPTRTGHSTAEILKMK
jgi:hypothetical protein